MGLVRVGAGTSYSPSRASITPCNRPSCCRKSCSTLQNIKKREPYLAVGMVLNQDKCIYVAHMVPMRFSKSVKRYKIVNFELSYRNSSPFYSKSITLMEICSSRFHAFAVGSSQRSSEVYTVLLCFMH